MSGARTGQTAEAKAMNAVVAGVAPTLKTAGFKKQRHTFNRVAEPGLIHVVNFQMGQFPLGYDIPGLRPNLYGQFTVNLGVFVREVYEATQRTAASEFVTEPSCEFRVRLGQLLPARADQWWSLDVESGKLSEELVAHFGEYAEPWFAGHATRALIVELLSSGVTPAAGRHKRDGITLALMLAHRGERDRAERVLRAYLTEDHRPAHVEWVRQLAKRLGLEPKTEG